LNAYVQAQDLVARIGWEESGPQEVKQLTEEKADSRLPVLREESSAHKRIGTAVRDASCKLMVSQRLWIQGGAIAAILFTATRAGSVSLRVLLQ
jgi:hypothetical protein